LPSYYDQAGAYWILKPEYRKGASKDLQRLLDTQRGEV